MSPDSTPITEWIRRAEAGDTEAVRRLFECLYPSLVRVAGRLLKDAPIRRTVADEDLAISAFEKYRLATKDGGLKLEDRDHLWHLLLRNLRCKLIDKVRTSDRQKHNPGTPIVGSNPEHGDFAIEQCPSRESPVEFEVMLADELGRLDHDAQRQTAVMWLEGCTVEEIAARLKKSAASINRYVKRIRTIWKEDLQ